MARILVTEEIADGGLERLRQAGHTVDIQLDLSHEQLLSAVKGAHALIIRSATDVNAEVLEAGTDLVVVGRAGVGLDNVDVDTATRRGVMVCNAPESNIVSAAEQTMALLLSVARSYMPDFWWTAIFPGLAIFLAVFGFNLLGDGLRDVFDPRSKR